MNEYKILFGGTMGAGKTTAIAAISEIPPVSTDVQNNDASVAKATTTVGLDYGELTLDNGDKLRLYGTPGQERYAFMWDILSKGALGLIVLIDNSRADPAADLRLYLKHFLPLIQATACVIGVGRTEAHASPSLDELAAAAAQMGVMCPLVPVDVRQKPDVLLLLDLLLTQLEAQSDSMD